MNDDPHRARCVAHVRLALTQRQQMKATSSRALTMTAMCKWVAKVSRNNGANAETHRIFRRQQRTASGRAQHSLIITVEEQGMSYHLRHLAPSDGRDWKASVVETPKNQPSQRASSRKEDGLILSSGRSASFPYPTPNKRERLRATSSTCAGSSCLL